MELITVSRANQLHDFTNLVRFSRCKYKDLSYSVKIFWGKLASETSQAFSPRWRMFSLVLEHEDFMTDYETK